MAKSLTLPECVICYREAPDTPVATPCGHVFCRPCITTALQMKRHCPICRKKVAPKHLVNIIATETSVENNDSEEAAADNSSGDSSSNSTIKLEIKCIKCSKPPKCPEIASCGHAFCRACAHLWFETDLRCPSHDTRLDRRRLYSLFCDGAGSRSAARSSTRLPTLKDNTKRYSYDEDSFDSDDDSDSSYNSDDSDIASIGDNDIILVNRFVFALPPITGNGRAAIDQHDRHIFPQLMIPPAFALLQHFGRHPVILMQHGILPRLGQAGTNGGRAGGQQQPPQQQRTRRSFFF